MQVKIFEGHGNNEDDINLWLKANPKIEVINVNMIPMHDRYTYGEENICNQWIATIVIYRKQEETNEKR